MISKYIFIQLKQICIQKEILFIYIYIYIYIYIFHPIKTFPYYMNFSLHTALMIVSDLPFLFAKVRILPSVYKWNSSTMLYKSCKEGYRILEYCAIKVK